MLGMEGNTATNVIQGPLGKSLEQKIRTTVGAEMMTITPVLAEEMLTFNTRNRPMPTGKLKEYAGTMKAGRWMFTGEPIIFSPERLIDGQTRLSACIKADTPFQALVVFGAPDDAFSFIDVGKTRTASDIFAINDVKYHALMAAAIQWVIGYETGTLGLAAKGNARLDHAQLYDAYQKHQTIQNSAWVGNLFAQNRLTSPSTMVALHYLCSRKSKSAADEFFRTVGEGIGFASKKDATYKLHKRLIENVATQERLGRKSIAAMTVKAWNAWRLKRDVGVLRFNADEAFPKVI